MITKFVSNVFDKKSELLHDQRSEIIYNSINIGLRIWYHVYLLHIIPLSPCPILFISVIKVFPFYLILYGIFKCSLITALLDVQNYYLFTLLFLWALSNFKFRRDFQRQKKKWIMKGNYTDWFIYLSIQLFISFILHILHLCCYVN